MDIFTKSERKKLDSLLKGKLPEIGKFLIAIDSMLNESVAEEAIIQLGFYNTDEGEYFKEAFGDAISSWRRMKDAYERSVQR